MNYIQFRLNRLLKRHSNDILHILMLFCFTCGSTLVVGTAIASKTYERIDLLHEHSMGCKRALVASTNWSYEIIHKKCRWLKEHRLKELTDSLKAITTKTEEKNNGK